MINVFDYFKLPINFFVFSDGHVVGLFSMRAHTCKCKGVMTNFAVGLDSVLHVVAQSFAQFCVLSFRFNYLSRRHFDQLISCVLFVVLDLLRILLKCLSWWVV